MKHPDELRDRLTKQWKNPDVRERRLLTPADRPLDLTIGRPPSAILVNDPAAFRHHLQSWQEVEASGIGTVISEEVNYRAASQPISVPKIWRLENPSEWIKACDDSDIEREFRYLGQIIEQADACFHRIIVRQKNSVLKRGVEEAILTTKVAMALEPGYAEGKPLRGVSVGGCDSKFFERNKWLLKQFLSVRFGDAVLDLGLEKFLDASKDTEHWLLVIPLESGLLPFKQQRVRASDLIETPLVARNILVIENFECVFQLPALPDTIAILGAGKDLSWLSAVWLKEKNVAYWGDMDTWGLGMLSAARKHLPLLTPLMMDLETFECYAKDHAVVEVTRAGESAPAGLTKTEVMFYRYLYDQEEGRIEQEFLPSEFAAKCIEKWWEGLSISSKV